ncbi:MAG: phage holin family protein [Georgfuchsia sp.]
MDIKPPDAIGDLLPWLSTIALSAWGGAVQYAQRVRQGEKFSWPMLTIDIVISSFAGVLTWFMCEAGDIHGPMAAVLIAISGHMGTRAIASLVTIRERIFGPGARND